MRDLPANYDVRYTERGDEFYLYRWLQQPNVLKGFPFDSPQHIGEFTRNWISFCQLHSSLTAVIDGVPSGIATLFLMPYTKVMHLSPFYLVVPPPHQGRGIGSSLMKNLLHLAKKKFSLEMIYCEVAEDSAMLPLLQKFSFEEHVRQKRFLRRGDTYKDRLLFQREVPQDMMHWDSKGGKG